MYKAIFGLLFFGICFGSLSHAGQENTALNQPAPDCATAITAADVSLTGPIGPQITTIDAAIEACKTTTNKALFDFLIASCGNISDSSLGNEGRALVRVCWLRSIEYIVSIDAAKPD